MDGGFQGLANYGDRITWRFYGWCLSDLVAALIPGKNKETLKKLEDLRVSIHESVKENVDFSTPSYRTPLKRRL